MHIFNRQFPNTRLRRLRVSDGIREMVRETHLAPCHLIAPVFVIEGSGEKQAIASMPNVYRYTIDLLIDYVKSLYAEGVRMIDIFPVINPALKTADGQDAYHPETLAVRAVRAIKDAVPEMIVMTDVALDPYTTHGQDGIIDESGYVMNDITTEALVKQTLAHAQAGADVISPSDMMDGRIRMRILWAVS